MKKKPKNPKPLYSLSCPGYWFETGTPKFIRDDTVKWGKKAYSSNYDTWDKEEAFAIQDKIGIECIVTEWYSIKGKRYARDYTLVEEKKK